MADVYEEMAAEALSTANASTDADQRDRWEEAASELVSMAKRHSG